MSVGIVLNSTISQCNGKRRGKDILQSSIPFILSFDSFSLLTIFAAILLYRNLSGNGKM
jgi:hypothetical protein